MGIKRGTDLTFSMSFSYFGYCFLNCFCLLEN
jgi:hypothetical protein